MMETGNVASVKDMALTAGYAPKRTNIQGNTQVDGKMTRNMWVCTFTWCKIALLLVYIVHWQHTLYWFDIQHRPSFSYLDIPQGFGTHFYSHSASYEGEWSDGQRSGWGRMYYANGDIYEGEWLKDQHHGQGMLRLSKGMLLMLYCPHKIVRCRLQAVCMSVSLDL